MCDPTAIISIGSFQSCPLNFLLLINDVRVIYARQIFLVSLCSCIASVVSRGLEEIVIPHMELR